MNKSKNKQIKKKSSQSSSFAQLAIFVLLVVAVVLIAHLLTSNEPFSFVKTIYQGNGIYNAFFNNADVGDYDIPPAVTEAETQVPKFLYSDVFGKIEHSPIAVMISATDGSVVLDKDKDRMFFPASITKVMTAIVVYENIPDLSTMVSFDHDIFVYCTEQNAAISGFLTGEKASALELLYGTLITSGADCAIALAKHIAGSEEAFAVLMNEKCAEFGLENTNFVNCTGLHNAKHYSTAHDLAIIMQKALEIDLLREIMTTRNYRTKTATMHPEGLAMVSTVTKAFNKARLSQGKVLGGKTGFTDDALLCLASFADVKIEDTVETFILVTLGAGEGGYDTPYHIYDANLVFNTVENVYETSN
jgi:D-alanyl-D-alanine carboxypeptidase (penicillin-binding protein 5/6)